MSETPRRPAAEAQTLEEERAPSDLRDQAEEAAREGRPLREGQALPRRTTRLVPSPVQILTAVALAAGVFAAPFLADAGLEHFGTRTVAAVALGFSLSVLFVRFLASREWLVLAREGLGPIALLGVAFATGEDRWLLFVPALVNATLAVVFARSALSREPGTVSMIERGARLMQPYLPDFTANYCRILTLGWALWFAVFAFAIAWAAVATDRGTWRFVSTTLYFGGIAIVNAVEFVHRKIWFRNYGPGPIDQLFQRFFPCEATWRGRRSKEYLRHIHTTLYGRSRFE